MIAQKKRQEQWIIDANKFLTSTEVHRLLRIVEREKQKAVIAGRKTDIKDWFLVCVAIETGLRVQEIADLSCGDFQMYNGQNTLVVRNGKGGKKRLVHIREEFCVKVSDYFRWKQKRQENTESDAPVFCVNHKRMSKRALQYSYKRSLAKAGIIRPKGVGVHSLRHTYASFLLKASKFNLRLVQRQLGHESMKTTEVYAHVFDEDMTKALERLYV